MTKLSVPKTGGESGDVEEGIGIGRESGCGRRHSPTCGIRILEERIMGAIQGGWACWRGQGGYERAATHHPSLPEVGGAVDWRA